jgi:eukaryotic-like serine/threonine-protein kinase
MQLAPGARLGPYEITAAIGEGGMGQVYKARDTRLDRTVAIKILPALLAADLQFRERFDREARAISQLDHPHICPLHDVGEQDGTSYLVMPFLDGETLEQRLQRRAVNFADAIQIATQIADALARAHSIGIIHRDLKPANIMLTRTGARLLDFGLAKTRPAAPLTQLTQTQPARLTTQGTIIGTFHYMAPEQIEGADGDARTDVWGFGCVLYEMLTGTRPFDGKSTASVLANILHAPLPPVRDRAPGVSRAIDHIAQRCLERDPDARWQSMADVAQELRWAGAADESAPVAMRSIWKQPAAYAAALLFAAGGFALSRFMLPFAAVPVDSPVMKLAFVAPAGLTFTPFGSNGNPHFALSPDGSRIAYVAAAAGRAPSLWVQRLDSRAPQEVPGSSDAAGPFWSSDSRSLGFFSEGKLRRSGLASEQSQVLATTDAAQGTWSGEMILLGSGVGPITRISAAGGRPSPVTTVEAGEVGHRWPQFLSDGRHFIYSPTRAGGARLGALDSTASSVLLTAVSTAVPFGSSHVLFVPPESTTLQAQELDLASLTVVGAPRDIAESVRANQGSGYPPVSVSNTGLLAYWDGTTVATALTWYDRTGATLAGLPVPNDPANFEISPDGRRLMYQRRLAEGGGIWLMDMDGVTSRLPVSAPDASRPIWASDGASIAFTATGSGGLTLGRRALSSTGSEQVLGTFALPDRAGDTGPGRGPANFYANDWTGDGRVALLSVTQPQTGRDILVFAADTHRVTSFVQAAGGQVQPRFSPDERWVAYTSNETGRWEVFVERFPGGGVHQQVSYGGGAQPVWRRDGKELFFAAPDGKLMSVAVTPGDLWVPANPRALFATRVRPLYAPYPYTFDVTPDGQRFLVRDVIPQTGAVISLITDWRRR